MEKNKICTPKKFLEVTTSGDVKAIEKLNYLESHINCTNPLNNLSMTPLYKAVQNNCKEMVVWLLEQGADPNAKDIYAWTPLHRAAQKGYVNLVELLLQRRANYEAITNKGKTPEQLAKDEGNAAVVKCIQETVYYPGVRKAARLLAQGYRDSGSLFNVNPKLPKEILHHVASFCSESNFHSKDIAETMAVENFFRLTSS